MVRRHLLALALLALPAVACASGRRNVVLFIGDGMGFRAVELASLWATGRPDAAPFADWPLRMAMSTPPAGAGTSVSILSVLISSSGSSFSTWSPGALSQRATWPSITLSPSFGIRTAVGMRGL